MSQLVPNGPRTPSMVPGPASCSAVLTAPTARMVCTSVPSAAAGSPLTEIAISPMPGAASIMNWPARNGGSARPAGVSTSVAESRVSTTRSTTR